MAAIMILSKRVQLGERHVAVVKLQQVPKSSNRPDGFKLNCALIDLEINRAVLILDNHSPFGYHIHMDPLNNHQNREILTVANPMEAMDIFLERAEAKRI